MAPLVVLFRSPTAPPAEDEYHKELLAHGFEPYSIPVLSFKFDNQQELTQKLKESSKYGGMVLTSQRAVEAIELCVTNFISHEVWRSKTVKGWQEKAVFVVGKATAKAAHERLGLESCGHDAGSADALVPIILQSVKPGSDPLLFPCGNLRRETIPNEMAKAEIALDGIQVYSTCADSKIKQSLEDFIREKVVPSYAVFFSPSGVNFTQDVLSGIPQWCNVKLVAIGKTTAEAMKNKGWSVKAVAEQPNSRALAQCITNSAEDVSDPT
ncbi:hypothetical protein ACROYT_G004335 [Oculina patagonica]